MSIEQRETFREADVAERAISLRGTQYPVVLPALRDPRLGIAAVVLSLHALGQLVLHWPLSVPQILAAILTCAILDFVITFYRRKAIVWPASALLTGSGVALLMRVVGTPADSPWATNDLYMFAGVAAFSLLQKYIFRYKGRNIFNPSNIGLVLAFLIFGNSRLEPLNLWWTPLNIWMILAYAIILVGGTYVVWRAKMLTVSVTFFVAFAALQAILAGSGHCMTANWAFAPVCGAEYYRIIVTSPEVFIYAYFMVTDPPTVPAGRVGRFLFAISAAAMATLLMAPQTDEFGTKVALLGGLTILLSARPLLERLVPEPRSAQDTIKGFAARLMTGGHAGRLRPVASVGLMAVLIAVVGGGVVFAGTPARAAVPPDMTEVLNGLQQQINPGTLPPITVNQSVKSWDHEVADSVPQLLVILAQNLGVEGQALLKADGSLFTAVDHGDRLKEMQTRLAGDQASGTCIVDVYQFDSVNVTLIVPFGVQSGLSLGFDARGTVTHNTYDSAGKLLSQQSSTFANTFAIRRATGARWLNVAVLPAGTGT
ncbi:MAG TPA: RnfABCDGE type electron transport complex subunit D [Candidatus Limnocylindrales bacterium]